MSLKIPDSNISKPDKEDDLKDVSPKSIKRKSKFKEKSTNLFAKAMLLKHKQAKLNNKKQFNNNPWGVDKHTYIFIDFETANVTKTSACHLAIIKVKKGKIIDSYKTFIKPHPYQFTFFHVNNITEEKVENAPTFNNVWAEILSFFDEKSIVIAHNADLYISILRSLLEHYNLECPNFRYLCSVKLFKKTYDYASNKLNTLAHINNIKFDHNDELADVKTLHLLINVHFGNHYHIPSLCNKLNIKLEKLYEEE